MCPVADTISGNETNLSFAEEASLKVLPGSPIWFELEPNSYSDLGAPLSKVSRNPINNTRQRKKGTIVDLDAAGGFNSDVTQNNFVRLMQGFFFADAHQKADTFSLNLAQILITGISATTGIFSAASGLDIFLVGDLVLSSGNPAPANNDFGVVSVATATDVTTDIVTVLDASPTTDSALAVVGFQFDANDATLDLGTGEFTLGSTVKDMTEFALELGEWVYIGGDDSSTQFASGTGYARVKSISTNAIVFDKATWTVATNTGAGKSIRIFFDVFQNNADDPDDIICRSYQLERVLGSDSNGPQSQILTGSIANEFTLNLPLADKLNADLSFIALDEELRDGIAGLKSGTRVNALGEEAFNTSSDVFRTRMSIIDETTLDPTDLFAFLSELNLKILNNVTAVKAVGVIGGFSINVGSFDVSGTATAYFRTVAALTAVRNNSDVTIDVIIAKNNAGLVYDIPLLGVKVDALSVELNVPITIPIEQDGAENQHGYTMGLTNFRYLPTVAIPLAQ